MVMPLRTGSGRTWTSHAVSPQLPSLQLGSSMNVQVSYEHYGRLIDHASSLAPADKIKIVQALYETNTDLTKSQSAGHTHSLAARLAESAIHHILFAKGQISEPISISRHRRQAEDAASQPSSRSRNSSTKIRKEDRMLRKLDLVCTRLKDAFDSLTSLDCRPKSSSNTPHLTNKDTRLLLVLGPSALMPREAFVIDLIDVVRRTVDVYQVVEELLQSYTTSADTASLFLADLLVKTTACQREKARAKTSSQWERKLVRMMVSAEDLEPFFGSPLAPTKLHIFLSTVPQFRCPGWSPRRHVDFDLRDLFGDNQEVSALEKATMSSDNPDCQEPKQDFLYRFSENASLSSEAEDHNSPDSSTGSAMLLNEKESFTADVSNVTSKRSIDVSFQSETAKRLREGTTAANLHAATRRAKAPAIGSLLSRNLLRPKVGSEANSIRSSRKHTPRCAGIRIDFSDPESQHDADTMSAPIDERCWFQCDSVLEGYR